MLFSFKGIFHLPDIICELTFTLYVFMIIRINLLCIYVDITYYLLICSETLSDFWKRFFPRFIVLTLISVVFLSNFTQKEAPVTGYMYGKASTPLY